MKKALMTLAKQISEKTASHIKGETANTASRSTLDVHETENALIQSFSNKDMYYNQMNYVKDEKLINYYSYLLKAEDEKIGYLQKLLLSMQVK